ncbi:MAG TPA: TetR/AcrR family transcriptional regulator [Caldithrix abyssi]|uniref:TetR/AcrR family transcriptional regulator n=1 Tax=Caldithrix abyssi TaxID=187145 RepID=A0A7V5PMW6_CALAY|nr:TetR/AcrR family transcriptional regulator [Caldithrix abyssi]
MGIAERRERERLQRRKEIVDTAERIIFSVGLDKATMDAIAEEAELSKATLYLYFNSKIDLYFAIYLRGQQKLFKLIDKRTRELPSPQDKIKAFLQALVYFQDKFPNYFDAFYYFLTHRLEVSKNSEDLQASRELDDQYLAKWMELIDNGKKEGLIRKDMNAPATALIIWLQLVGFLKVYSIIHPELKEKFNINRDELLEEYYNLLFKGIFR